MRFFTLDSELCTMLGEVFLDEIPKLGSEGCVVDDVSYERKRSKTR